MALNDLNELMNVTEDQSLLQDQQSNMDMQADTQSAADQSNSLTTNLFVNSLNQQDATTQETTSPTGRGGIAPKHTSAGNPALRISGAPNFKSMDDFYAGTNAELKQNPLYESGAVSGKWTDKHTIEKYDDQDYGYLYNQDNDDFYGKRESWLETAYKVPARLSMGVINKVGMGVGFIAGLVNPWNWGEAAVTDENLISIAADNALYKVFEASEEFTKNEWLPTFQEAADRKKGFWQRLYSDGDFWADDFVDGVSFLAAAWIPGAVLGELGAGAAMAARLGKGAQSLGLAVEAGEVAANVERASTLSKWFAESGRAAKQLDKFNSWALATSSEAMFEAASVRKDILNSPDYDVNGDAVLNPKTGRPFTPDEKRKMAGQGALNTFLMNTAILGISNAWELKYVNKLLGRGAASAEKGLLGGAATLGEEAIVNAPEAFWKTALKTGVGGTIAEGFWEENAQLAVQRYNTQYGLQGKLTGIFDPNTWIETSKQLGNQTVAALKGDDNEAAQSIGMGGLIGSLFGTYTSRKEVNRNQMVATQMMSSFNDSQNSWLKAGNIFQTQEVDAFDKNGNPIKSKQFVLDKNGIPVLDNNKIFATVTGMKLNADMFGESVNEAIKYKHDLLRDRSFADFVVAHINAGLEDRLMTKLDQLQTADPEALAKLGFTKDASFNEQLQKYKGITNDILEQNKLISDNVIFRNTSLFDKKNVVDNSRRAHLVEIGARQVVNKHVANQVDADYKNLKSKLVTDAETDLNDGIVDQLNDMQHRIKSQEDLIKHFKDNGMDSSLPMEVYEKVLTNLKADYNELVTNNDATLKDLTKNDDGTYRYKKNARNESTLLSQLNTKSQTVGELKNEIANDTQLFSFFADRATGRDNFIKFFNSATANALKNSDQKIDAEEKKQAEEKKKEEIRKEFQHTVVANPDGTYSVKNKDGIVVANNFATENEATLKATELTATITAEKEVELKAKEEEERKAKEAAEKAKAASPTATATSDLKAKILEVQTKLDNLPDNGIVMSEKGENTVITSSAEYDALKKELETLKKQLQDLENAKASDENAPTLESFLKEKFQKLSTNPDFKLTYEQWIKSGSANQTIRDYNKLYNKTEELIKQMNEPTEVDGEEELNNLDLENVNMSNFRKSKDAILKVYRKIISNIALVQRLIEKIDLIKDPQGRAAMQRLIATQLTGSEYVPLNDAGVDVYNPEHPFTGDIVNIDLNELTNGFTLIGDTDLLNMLRGSGMGSLNDKVVVMATVKFVRDAQEKLAKAGIGNRTMITLETPKEIRNKLQRNIPVIAKAHKSEGFNIQIFSKDNTNSNNIWLGGIDNYAIIFPDNTTEKITFSEDQREFVKNNMLVDGVRMTDEHYDRLQDFYGKMEKFQAKVAPLLEEYMQTYPNDESMDISKLFDETFTLSRNGFEAKRGEAFEDILRNAPQKLFTINVTDESGNVTEKTVPLLAFRTAGSKWMYQFPLNEGEYLVTVDKETGETSPANVTAEYLKEVHGITPELTNKFPGVIAWISNDKTSPRGYKPYTLSKQRGTEPVAMFKNFANEFRELKTAIEEGLNNGGTGFKYKGQTFNTIKDLMKHFNIKQFGFFKYGDFIANMSFNKDSIVSGKKSGKFLFEIRPADRDVRNSLTSNEKRALNLYFDFNDVDKVTDASSDEDVTKAYNAWVDSLRKGYEKLVNNLDKGAKLEAAEKNKLKGFRSTIDSHILFNYEEEGNNKVYFLKLQNKQDNVSPMPLLQWDAAEAKGGLVQLTFNEGVEGGTETKVEPTVTSSNDFVSMGTLDDNGFIPNDTARAEDLVREMISGGRMITQFSIEEQQLIYSVSIERLQELKDEVENGTSNVQSSNLTKEAQDLLAGLSSGSMPTFITKNLEKIANDNGIEVTGKMTAVDVINALKEKQEPVAPPKTKGKRKISKVIKPDEEAPFMLEETEENYEKYTSESFSKEVEWLKKALGNTGIKLEDLGGIINDLLAGKQVLGYYKNKAIFVSEALSKKGTIFHEAFHGLFRDIMSPKLRSFYLQKAKTKYGYINNAKVDEFRNDRRFFNKTDEEIRELMYEEKLAEGFRKYKLDKKEPKEGWFKNFIKIFDRIINFFKTNKDSIEDLYKNFDEGRFNSNKTQAANNISDEGAFSLAYGRPKLSVVKDEEDFTEDRSRPLNIDLQNQLINKLAYQVAIQSNGTFTEKFVNAIKEVKKDYDMEALIKSSDNPTLNADAIRSRYAEEFNEALFVLGDSVPYVLDESISNDEDALELRTEPGANIATMDLIRKAVDTKLKTLGVSSSIDGDNLEIPETDEDRIEKEKGGEFDTIHMNPLQGLSTEFRSLFSMIPYSYKDDRLGVTINKMADGAMLFNAMIKVAANTAVEQLLPSLQKGIDTLSEDNDPSLAPLKAFGDFIKSKFGIAELSDSNAKPSKNIHLYKQFIDTFFVTELPSQQIVMRTTADGSTATIYDASINQDVLQKKEAIKFKYEQAYRTLRTPEAIEEFNTKFEKLQEYIRAEVIPSLKRPDIVNARTKELNKIVNKVKNLFDDVNINLSKNLIRQSFLAIYNLENELEFSNKSVKNMTDMETDQRLMKEGSYLQRNFWFALTQIKKDNYSKIFTNTKEEFVDLGGDLTKVDQINAIVKGAMKYAIKYDINSAISVFQNAESKKIWRYSRYTPPVLLAQIVRDQGVQVLNELYPVLQEWYNDNPLFDGSDENNLFLKNLQVSAHGGFRQEIDDDSRNGVTFSNMDSKALLLSGIVNFMNRSNIIARNKNDKSKPIEITTFNRSRTQEEATTTNFLITARYQKFIDKTGNVNDLFMTNMRSLLKQEYNRIKREWQTRTDSKVRYKGYNINVHPENQSAIEGDSYETSDGKTVNLRAYQFENFKHFFDEQKTNEGDQEARTILKEKLREAAKNGLDFEDAMSETIKELPANDITFPAEDWFNDLFTGYMDETFKTYSDALEEYQITEKDKDDVLTSKLVPNVIKREDDPKGQLIGEYGYEDMGQLLKDHHLNIVMSKMMVNQIFDGDIATGIKSSVEYYKRNKSGVISGNSMKTGHVRTAVVDNIQADVNGEDLTEYSKDITNLTDAKRKVDTADGQAWHVINHRIRMMDSWGRVSSQVRQLLNISKYRELTKDEIETLEDNKVVLNSIKTATGGILEYYKLSEHLLSRTEVSHLVMPQGLSIEDVYKNLDDLYSQIETLEDLIVENPSREDAKDLEDEIKDLYTEVHKYWEPRRSREKLHHMLNSMEMSGIDMLFDPNASKKTTVAPVKLNTSDYTDLTLSKSTTSGLFKFLQVETSGLHNTITLPTQARQLLTTYINKLNNDRTYMGKTIKQLTQEYSNTLGEISKSNMNMLDKTILDKDGEINTVELYKMMRDGLEKQGVDSNTLKFFEIKNGEPVHNPNLPVIKKLFTYYYFAMFNNSVFSENVSGRSDILVSSYGHEVLYDTTDNRIITRSEQNSNPSEYKSSRYATRHLGVSVEEVNGQNVYTIEVIIPEPLANNAAEKQLYLEKLNKFFSTRIPTEDKRSMIVCKVVDYLEPSYRNSIIVPQLIHILAGSDLDVDKLYSHTFNYYMDYNDSPHVYGDYSGFATESQGRFAEYMMYMQKSPALKDAINAELEKVAEKPVFSKDFEKIRDEIGLSNMDYTADEMKEMRKNLAIALDGLYKEKKDLQVLQDTLFDNHIRNNQRHGTRDEQAWRVAQQRYFAAKDSYEQKLEEIKALKTEQAKIENTLKLAATINVLNGMGLPVTQSALTAYSRKNGNPVIPVIQNLSLQQKIDLLSNEVVFKEHYIKEVSDAKAFKQIATDIGASVEDVVKQNSIYSIMGDIVANELNSSNKDGIGIAASFNKFLAFAEKNSLSLNRILFRTVDEDGNLMSYSDFLNTEGIKNIGKELGMFADAAKDPIPSVLNLNPDTVGASNLLMGMSGNLQLGILINKIPFIEKATREAAISKSAAQTRESRFGVKKVSDLLNQDVIKPIMQALKDQGRLLEMFELDKEGNIDFTSPRELFIETVKPQNIVEKQAAGEKISLEDLGFILRYDDGSLVAEDVASVHLAELYNTTDRMNGDIIKLGRVLNLIKDQKPDFTILDQMLDDVNYLMSGDSVFGDSIVSILGSSTEYAPLVDAARKMSEYSRSVLIERTPLFKAMNGILQSGFTNIYGDSNARENISGQITKFIIINKSKIEIKKQLAELAGKEDDTSITKRKILEESMKYFTSDFWLNNNTLVDDLDYLYQTNQGNPFVEFLKVNVNKGIDYLEGSTRMKLDKDVAENIINGYEALQKSKDERTLVMSRQMFYYLLVKDGLGYGANTFISYLNPELNQFKEVSDSLDGFQKMLASQQDYITKKKKLIRDIIDNTNLKDKDKRQQIDKIAGEITKNFNDLFDVYFNNETKTGQVDWINGIVTKIFSNVSNQRYIGALKNIDLGSKEMRQVFNDLLQNGVFSHLTDITMVDPGTKKFDLLEDAGESFSIDFAKFANKKIDPNTGYLFNKILIKADPITNVLDSVGYPILLSNYNGKVYKLVSVDGINTSDDIAKRAVMDITSTTMFGIKAEYRELSMEGTSKLLNFGFSAQDGKALQQHVKNVGKKTDAEEAAGFFMYSSIDGISENQEVPPSSYGYEGQNVDEGPYFIEESGFMSDEEAAKFAKPKKNDGTKTSEELTSSNGINGLEDATKQRDEAAKLAQKPIQEFPAASQQPVATPQVDIGRYVKYNGEIYIVTQLNGDGTVQIYNPTKEGSNAKKSVAKKNLEPLADRAQIVTYLENGKDGPVDYIVTSQNNIISLVTNKIQEWGEENGNRKAIIALADKVRKSQPTPKVVSNSNREVIVGTIDKLGPKEIFVFGSNTEGRHGLGAAKDAKTKFGAVQGTPAGLQGQSYGIVTKNLTEGIVFNGEVYRTKGVRSVPLNIIGKQVQELAFFAKENPGLKFYMTKIGTENAGYTVAEIKDIFEKLKDILPDNVILPAEFETRGPINTATAESQVVTVAEVEALYAKKAAAREAIGKEMKPKDEWMKEAKTLVDTLKAAGTLKENILIQLKQCL